MVKNHSNQFFRAAALAPFIAITMMQSANADTGTWNGLVYGRWDITATHCGLDVFAAPAANSLATAYDLGRRRRLFRANF